MKLIQNVWLCFTLRVKGLMRLVKRSYHLYYSFRFSTHAWPGLAKNSEIRKSGGRKPGGQPEMRRDGKAGRVRRGAHLQLSKRKHSDIGKGSEWKWASLICARPIFSRYEPARFLNRRHPIAKFTAKVFFHSMARLDHRKSSSMQGRSRRLQTSVFEYKFRFFLRVCI